MQAAKAIVKNRVLILIVALALMIPATLGMLGTRINYDMLNYLPDDMDTVIGQDAVIGGNAFITHSIAPGMRVSVNNQELEMRMMKDVNW